MIEIPVDLAAPLQTEKRRRGFVMNRKPNAPKCILGVVMVVLLVIGGWATTTARLTTKSRANIATVARPVATVSPQSVGCGTSLQVDGNAFDDTGAGLPEDWDTVVGDGTASSFPIPGSVAIAASFVIDTGASDRIYTGGSTKDFIDINQWQHKVGSVPDKDEIDNAFAALYNDPSGNRILYFGGDRHAVNGDAQIGFWFFQNPVAPITSGPNAGKFSGVHKNGDLLILSLFTGGGSVPTLQIFKWVGTPGTGFQDCTGGILDNSGTLCDITAIADQGNALTNVVSVPSPWAYTPKSGTAGSFPPNAFFEGCLNLSDAGIANECFSTFVLETRSSQSTDAVLKDFALGNFQQCSVECSKIAAPTTVCDGQSTTYTYTAHNPSPIALTVSLVDDNETPADATDDIDVLTGLPLSSQGGVATTIVLQPDDGVAGGPDEVTRNRNVTLSLAGSPHTNTFTVTIVNQSGVPPCVKQATVTVVANPTVTVNSPAVCAGNSATITATPNPAGTYTYVWTVPLGVTNPGNVSSFSATVAGDYCVTITDANGCTGSGCGTLTVNPNPVASIAAVACADSSSITLTASATINGGNCGTCTFSWTGPGGASTGATRTATAAGVYTVTATSQAGCTGTASTTVGLCTSGSP